MDDTYVVINLLYESEDKINNVFKIIKKHPYINIFRSIHWSRNNDIINFFNYNKLNIFNKKLLSGEYAIWVTYIQCFQKLLNLDSKYKYFIILEDDVILPDNFLELVFKYYLSNKYLDIFGGIKLGHNLVGSIYTRDKIIQILNYIQNNPIEKAIDQQLSNNDLINEPTTHIVDYNKKILSERIESKKVKNIFYFQK